MVVWSSLACSSLERLTEVTRLAYASAYVDGAAVALFVCGLVGLGGAFLAWVLIGQRAPLQTVFDLEEERRPGHGGSVSQMSDSHSHTEEVP